MADRINRLGWPLVRAVCVLAAALVLFAGDLAGYMKYSKAVRSGEIQTYTLTLEDCELASLKKLDDGIYAATDTDPQIVFTPEGAVAAVSMEMKCAVEPGEILVFGSESGQERFNESRMWFAHPDGEGRYTARLASDGGYVRAGKVRIDPTSYAGNRLETGLITVNPPLGAGQFIRSDRYRAFEALILGLLAAVIIKSGVRMVKKTETE